MKKIYAFILSLLCMIGMSLPVYAEGTSVQDLNNQKVNLTINNVSKNEKFRVWKVVDIKYETSTNEVTYAWNKDFKDYFSDKTIKTPQEFAAITNSDQLNELLSGLPLYIKTELVSKNIPPIGGEINSGENTQIVMSGDKALNMGGYFIEPIDTTKVYQPMFVSIVPTVSGGSYQLENREFTAKHTDCGIRKLVSNDNSNYDSYTCASFSNTDKYNRLYYKVTLDVPKYVSPDTNDINIEFEDTLPNGIDLDSGSIKIYGLTGNTNSIINNIPITIEGKKIKIDFKNYYTAISTYDYILIEYEANLNENAVKNFVDDANVNSAKYTYTKYPYSGSVSNKNVVKTSSAKVYTYDVKILKSDKNDESKRLGGAQFDLYRLADQDELDDSSVVKKTIDSRVFVKIASGLTIKTSSEETDKGTYLISGLVPGEYRLIETKAPSGYILVNTPIAITINLRSQRSTQEVKIFNTKGLFTLPETGSTGKLLYSLAGLALASIATICLIVVYKKGKKG